MNIKFLLPKARGFVEKGKIPKRASQRFRGLIPLQHMLPTDGFIDKVEEIVATATEEISRHEVFDFQKSKVFELITEENLNLYLELIPSSVLGSDFIFSTYWCKDSSA